MRNTFPPPPHRPSVSFVIATYNRGQVAIDCLHRTLTAAKAALGDAHFQISIVDNASTDNTLALLQTLARANPDHLRIIPLPENRGPVAKNAALENNPADLIIFLDDDAYPLPGALAQMIHHFQDDAQLGAAVFDVTLPDGTKEASAYPDVFIGAGTALRGEALRRLPNPSRSTSGPLPADFFMQAEEYDLSFRLLSAGWTIQRFWDMPLLHLKTPGARIGERTTRLDVRNNLWLLAKYLPEPLCWEFAGDWLARYWRMALSRDRQNPLTPTPSAHKKAFIQGCTEGLDQWNAQRATRALLLSDELIERIFRFEAIHERLRQTQERFGLRRIAFGDWGKNILPFWKAATSLDIPVLAIADGNMADEAPTVEYRGIPLVTESAFRENFQPSVDAVIVTAISPVHAARRVAALRRILNVPVIDLFSKRTDVRPLLASPTPAEAPAPLLVQ